MANRICSYCGVGYTDEEGPHSYKVCVKRLDKQINTLIDRATILIERRQNAGMLVDERSQRET